AALDTVRAELGPISIMVTSAGQDSFEPFTDLTLESWDRILAINLTGTFHCLQAAVPDMLAARWGRMVTISSSSAQSGAVRRAHYVASTAGVLGLTKALALELAPHGITVNAIPPGVIDTPMARRAESSGGIGKIEKIAARIPVGRAGTPEDIAAICGFLCSEDAGDITGQVIGVNGGMALGTTRRKDRHAISEASPEAVSETPRGNLDGTLSRAGNRPRVLRELDLARVLRARARGHLQAGLAERRAGRAAPPKGQLLHQGARGRAHLADRRPGHGRQDPRLPQRLPPPRQQAGVDRPPGRGDQRNLPAVRLQVPRLEVRSRRPVRLHPSGGRVLRDRQGRLRPRPRALRGVARIHLREPRHGAQADTHRIPRPDDHRDRLPVRSADGALLLPRRCSQQLEGLSRCLPGVLPSAHPPRPSEPRDVAARIPGAGFLHHALSDRRPASGGFNERRCRRAPAAGDVQPHRAGDAQRPVRPVGRVGKRDRHAPAPLPPGLNPGNKKNWGLDSFQIFPNFAIVFWETGWYLTYHYWPTAHNRLIFEANAYFAPPRSVRERLAQQLGIATIKEYALQD